MIMMIVVVVVVVVVVMIMITIMIVATRGTMATARPVISVYVYYINISSIMPLYCMMLHYNVIKHDNVN